MVDLKTGKYPPTDKASPTIRSSASTSSPSTTAPPTRSWVAPSVSGGAELVQLRVGDELPKVQAQPPQPEVDGATTVQRQLMQIARAVRAEELVARPEQTLC